MFQTALGKAPKRYGQVYETTTTQQTDRHENHQRTTLIVLKNIL